MSRTADKMTNLPLIHRCAEFLPKDEVRFAGSKRRGIYVLYRRRGYLEQKPERERYDVLYIGMTDRSMRGRLFSHRRSKRMKGWTHFSVYEVWPNITEQQIGEMEGLLRHIYRRDAQANKLNRHKAFQPLRRCRVPARDFKKLWRNLS